MKGIRFYATYATPADKRHHRGDGNVFALDLDTWPANPSGSAALYDEPNSDTCGARVSLDYLRRFCRRIPEAEARIIHPKLLVWLDSFACSRCGAPDATRPDSGLCDACEAAS